MKIKPSYFGIKSCSQKIAAIIGIAGITEAKISHHGKALTPDTVISLKKLSVIFVKLRLTYIHFCPAKGWGFLLDRVLFLEPWPHVFYFNFAKDDNPKQWIYEWKAWPPPMESIICISSTPATFCLNLCPGTPCHHTITSRTPQGKSTPCWSQLSLLCYGTDTISISNPFQDSESSAEKLNCRDTIL